MEIEKQKEYQIDNIPVRINGTIKKVLDMYYDLKIPRTEMLEDYYAVLKYRDRLAESLNPWKHYRKNIKKESVERGMMTSETAFELGAMTLQKQKPTDVIRSAFYKTRNDSGVECDFLLKQYLELTVMDQDTLIINPSPDMILRFEEARTGKGRNYYVVPDKIVAGLYQMQFPGACFKSMTERDGFQKSFSTILLVSRDYDIKKMDDLLDWLECCERSVLAEVPNAYFDNAAYGVLDFLKNFYLGIQEISIIDSKAFMSTPKKKVLVRFDGVESRDHFLLRNCNYDKENKKLIYEDDEYIVANKELTGKLSLIQLWNKCRKPEKEEQVSVYGEAEEYVFSKEVHLFYNIYSERKNRFAGRAWYRKLENADQQKYGKRISPLIEKGLRAGSEEEVEAALWIVALDERVCSYIQNDLFTQYVFCKRNLTLKSLWMYLRLILKYESKYDEQLMIDLLGRKSDGLSAYINGVNTESELLEMLVERLQVSEEEIPAAYIEQLYLLFQVAQKEDIIIYNPLSEKMYEARNWASKRQQDIRQVLAKKHFSNAEEEKIFDFLIEKEFDVEIGRDVPRCVKQSIWLLGAIRLFSGISLREACALRWSDFSEIEDTKTYQLLVSKFLDADQKMITHAEKSDWKRFRRVPVAPVLSELLIMRKNYLNEQGIYGESLDASTIILGAEDMKNLKKKNIICKVSRAQEYCRRLVKVANIPEQYLLLPDAEGERYTDIYKYNGDIFLSNLRMRLNHECKMTAGQICYIIGVEGIDTLSRHYCDYSNSLMQYAMVEMMNRWTAKYLLKLQGKVSKPSESGTVRLNKVQQFDTDSSMCNEVDLVFGSDGKEEKQIEITVDCQHGAEVEVKRYKR